MIFVSIGMTRHFSACVEIFILDEDLHPVDRVLCTEHVIYIYNYNYIYIYIYMSSRCMQAGCNLIW